MFLREIGERHRVFSVGLREDEVVAVDVRLGTVLPQRVAVAMVLEVHVVG